MAESICWVCANAVPSKVRGTGCSWSKEFRFVEGCEYVHKRANGCDLYIITECPEFKLEIASKWGSDGGQELVNIDDWLRTGDAAKYLGVTAAKLRKLRDRGYVTCIGGRYSISDMDRVLAVFEEEKGMISTKEAARILGITPSRVSSLFYEGLIPHKISLRTGRALVRKEDVFAYKAKRGY